MEQKIYTSTSFEVLSTIHEVESELTRPVNRRVFGYLFTKLEKAQKNCHNQELLDKIIYLYGKIVDCYVNTEIQEIVSWTKRSFCNMQQLKQKIADVKLYGLSQENFAIIAKIEQKLHNIFPIITGSYEDIESSEELLLLASHIYYKDRKKARELYHTLSLEIQKCVGKHLFRLHTSPFHNDLLMLQALFCAAHELALRPLTRYPTMKEIKQFFLEQQAITGTDFSSHCIQYKAN